MIERLDNVLDKYYSINEELSKEENLKDFNKTKILTKEKKDLEEISLKYEKYKKILTQIAEIQKLITDPDFMDMARDELEELINIKKELEKELEVLLIPKDPNDGKNVIIELRGAAGGDEANIFAGDLYRMYTRFAEKNNWNIELINEVPGSSGGFSQVEFLVKGDNVYSKLKFESGSHRVQRVPNTETQGRVHTSTATVAVMPEAEEVDVELNDKDLKIDVFHSSGAGGQSVNTTDSAVRLTHLPTGIVVNCQTERSQLKNKNKALSVLKTKLYDEEVKRQEQELGAQRRSKVGTGDRSEKIRTYNYPQNRITDHRIGLSIMELEKVMSGNLEQIIEALILEDQKLKLADK